MTMRERIAAGKLFTDMCEGLPEDRLKAKQLQQKFNASDPADMEGRMQILSEIFGGECHAYIEPPFYFCYGTNISIEGAYINVNCNFIDDGKITIGKNVLFGPAVTIATVGHPIAPDMRGYMYCDPVTICDNVWVVGRQHHMPRRDHRRKLRDRRRKRGDKGHPRKCHRRRKPLPGDPGDRGAGQEVLL